MVGGIDRNFGRAFRLLKENGLLLVSGAEIPDVCRLFGGDSVKGSWWGSPFAHEIFAVNELLSEHEDVTITKIVSGKVTFVHRSLWPKLVAIGKAHEDWQMKQLSSPARRLLDELYKEGTLVTNSLGRSFGPKPGNTARELELKLLIHADQIHTSSGKHAKVLETWDSWTKRIGFKAPALKPETARRFFDKRLQEINERHQGCGQLPWS